LYKVRGSETEVPTKIRVTEAENWDSLSLTSESEDNIGRVLYVRHKLRPVASEVQKL